jgi:leucyl/phenylalanyl-tRNA--protein transferase
VVSRAGKLAKLAASVQSRRVLTTEQLLSAYASGFFPMAVNARGDIRWFSPDPRALIPLDERFHISHSLRRVLKKNPFTVTVDENFEGVIQSCATSHGKTWISKGILRAYCQLHRDGWAHSVETRLDGNLAGGLYGVHIRGAFFGESMFHRATDASKVALVTLVERLRARGFTLLDTQWTTPHLKQFGAFEISREDYLDLLAKALTKDCQF